MWKTPSGIRNVPISNALIELGFFDYVEECRAAPHRLLINHNYSKELSAATLEYQRAQRSKAPQTSFHSFRVNVITQMHDNDANAAKVMKLRRRWSCGPLGLCARATQIEAHRGQFGLADRFAGFAIRWPVRRFLANRNNWAPDKKPPAPAAATKAKPGRKTKAA